MIPPKERCGPCIVDNKCLANGIIYFSFLVPLHQQAVYDFVIGCATGQSVFVGIEQRCQCLVWASVPSDSILASYCLFEVLIDTSNGGKFPGCQFVINHLFQSFWISNKFKLHRLPYVVKRSAESGSNVDFVSTLHKIFKTNNLDITVEENMEKFNVMRVNTKRDTKHSLMTKQQFIRDRKNHKPQFKNVGERCAENVSMIAKKRKKSVRTFTKHTKPLKKVGKGNLQSSVKPREKRVKATKSVKIDHASRNVKNSTARDIKTVKIDHAARSLKHAAAREVKSVKIDDKSTSIKASTAHNDGTISKTGHSKAQTTSFEASMCPTTCVETNTVSHKITDKWAKEDDTISAYDVEVNIVSDKKGKDNVMARGIHAAIATTAIKDTTRVPDTSSPSKPVVDSVSTDLVPQSSSVTINCTSTSKTERVVNTRLATGLEEWEVRNQSWTPEPISDSGNLKHSVNKSNNSIFPNVKLLLQDWENRLYLTIKNYLVQDIF